MDGKKKRNRKKKANHKQDKHGDDTASNSNAEETVSHASEDVAALPADRSLYHHISNGQAVVSMDAQNTGVSESDAEVDRHRLYEAHFARLHESTRHLEDEKNTWIQRVMSLEHEVERLQGKLNLSDQNGIGLTDKIKIIEGMNDSRDQQEASLKASISRLEEVNGALQVQVKVLEESSSNSALQNQKLTERISQLESRMLILERKSLEYSSPAEQEDTKFVAGEDQSNDGAGVILNSNFVQDKTVPRGSSSIFYVEESVHAASETAQAAPSSGQIGVAMHELRDAGDNVDGVAVKPGLEEPPRSSGENIAIPMDEIRIHEEEEEDGQREVTVDGPPEEVPLIDAPLIGAPFRLISFFAKYVSGADLVDQHQAI